MRGEEPLIELGSSDGRCASERTLELLSSSLEGRGFKVYVDKKFKGAKGGTIISTFCDPPRVEAVQIELSSRIRRDGVLRGKFVEGLVEALKALV
jgi:N-formylglutamate amidohydrolase